MPHTLLLADDSVTIQRVIELTFADEDIRVVAVSDGDQAIAALDQTMPDIVLADAGMPGRSGYDVAQHVRQHPRLSHIPVLLLTGAFEPIDEGRAAQVGSSGVLAKPFEPQFVINRVRELLSGSGPADAHRRGAATEQSAAGSIPAMRETAPSTPAPAEPAKRPPARPAPSTTDIDSYFDQLDRAFATFTGEEPAHDVEVKQAAAPDDQASRREPSRHRDEARPDDDAWRGHEAARTDAAEHPDEVEIGRAHEPQHAEQPALASRMDEPGYASMPEPSEVDLDAPVTYGSPQSVFERLPELIGQRAPFTPEALTPAHAAPTPMASAAAASAPTAPRFEFPPLAEAFSALLAAEQGAAVPSLAPRWPAAANGGHADAAPGVGAAAAIDVDEIAARVTRQVLADMSDRVVRDIVAEIVAATAERLIREEIERIKARIQ